MRYGIACVTLLEVLAGAPQGVLAQVPDLLNLPEVRIELAHRYPRAYRESGMGFAPVEVWVGADGQVDSTRSIDPLTELVAAVLQDVAEFSPPLVPGWISWTDLTFQDLKPRENESLVCPSAAAFGALVHRIYSSPRGLTLSNFNVGPIIEVGSTSDVDTTIRIEVGDAATRASVSPTIDGAPHCESALQSWLADEGTNWILELEREQQAWLPPDSVSEDLRESALRLVRSAVREVHFSSVELRWLHSQWAARTTDGRWWDVECEENVCRARGGYGSR